MELGLVNFKKQEYNTEILSKRNKKIAELMGIPLNNLDDYTIIELSPFSQILLKLHLKIDFSPLRFYFLEEMDEEIYFFVENTRDLLYADSALKSNDSELKEFCLDNYENSINILSTEFFEKILKTPIKLNWVKNKAKSGFSLIDLRILAVIPNASSLINKRFEKIDLKTLDDIRETLYNNDMINKRDSSRYFFIINRVN